MDLNRDINLLEIKSAWNRVYKDTAFNALPWEGTEMPVRELDSFLSVYCNNDQNVRILDFGCGTGRLTKYIISTMNSVKVDLYDISDTVISKLKANPIFVNSGCYAKLEDIKSLYSGIVCWGVFHHLPQIYWSDYVRFFSNILLKGGFLLFGDFTTTDSNFTTTDRYISPTTGVGVYAVNCDVLNEKFDVIKKGNFAFQEYNNPLRRRIMLSLLCKKKVEKNGSQK
jgi:SAM-dependent methyltransferase